jgi:hypothetical protein
MTRVLSTTDLLRVLVLAAVALALPSVHVAPVKVPTIAPARVEAITRPPGSLPPVEYDKPYTGTLTVIKPRTGDELDALCGKVSPPGYRGIGCAFPNLVDGSCVIIIRENDALAAAGLDPAVVLRHEIGHCNGWPADHAGGR